MVHDVGVVVSEAPAADWAGVVALQPAAGRGPERIAAAGKPSSKLLLQGSHINRGIGAPWEQVQRNAHQLRTQVQKACPQGSCSWCMPRFQGSMHMRHSSPSQLRTCTPGLLN